jgi:hypothetical protein
LEEFGRVGNTEAQRARREEGEGRRREEGEKKERGGKGREGERRIWRLGFGGVF